MRAPASSRPRSPSGSRRKSRKAKVFYLGPDYEMGRSTVAAFKASAEKVGASSRRRSVRAARQQGLHAVFRSAPRGASRRCSTPRSPATTRCACSRRLQEFGLLNNLTVVGASGTVTSQNLGAIGKAAEGFVTGVGYSAEIDTPENKKFVEAFRAANKADPDLYGAEFLRSDLCLQGGGRKGQEHRHRQGARRPSPT